MIRLVPILRLAAGISLLASSVEAQLCDGPPSALTASRDLYCLELVPAPGLAPAAGWVELGRMPGPFTITVTPDGRQVFDPTIGLTGLPDPSSLGRYSTYVAWVATPVMYPIVKLGVVVNGRTHVPPIDLDKFIVLVTAEASAEAVEPVGRVVLRGASPSTRLQPPDFLRFAIGATLDTPVSAHDATMHPGHMGGEHAAVAEHGDAHGSDARMASADTAPVRWTTVPMPQGLTMPPAEMALRPAVAPYLPRGGAGVRLRDARPRQLVRLKDGDTLRLTAGFVRRTLRGRVVTMYGFNGQYPGPLLRVPQHAQVVVRLTNALDQPTTVHWHGVRLENQFDGVPGITQQTVPPGGRFTYRVRFPDAGIYWYHPHVREDIQQGLGLYGNLVVRSPRSDYFGPVNREEVLMIADLLVGGDGLVPFGQEGATHAFMGRFGNVFLVNGEPRYELRARRGEVIRFFLTNVSNTRTFNLSFAGARMKVVGSDVGNFEREEWVESVVIAPAERYIVHVQFDEPGTVALVNRVQGLDHLFGRFFYETDTLATVHVSRDRAAPDLGERFRALRVDSMASLEIDRFRRYFDRPADHSLVLTVETRGLPFVTRQLMQLDSAFFTPVEWSGTMPTMNWASTTGQVRWVIRDPVTGKENMDIGWRFHRGDVVKLRLVNERRAVHAMQHPIHIHGQRFLVLAVNGVRNEHLVWKDTVLIPAGSTADVLLELSNPGRWMLHCHIAEHLSAGMMTVFTVD